MGGAKQLRRRALVAVRPGVEALLLSAVALGCAQAGWGILAPPSAGAAGARPTSEPDLSPQRADLRSPFAPLAGAEGASSAAAALAQTIKLSGVRMSLDPARSGAVLTLEDGAQRAFGVGQEIAQGVRLSEVRAEYVLVSYSGGQRQIMMANSVPTYSFARAMMGQVPPAAAPTGAGGAVVLAVSAQAHSDAAAATTTGVAAPAGEGVTQTPFTSTSLATQADVPFGAAPLRAIVFDGAATPAGPEPAALNVGSTAPSLQAQAQGIVAQAETDAFLAERSGAPSDAEAMRARAQETAWLAATLANVEVADGQALGWRVTEPTPERAAEAGLKSGDLITAVNGVGPNSGAAALGAISQPRLELSIQRGADEHLTVTIARDART